VVSGKGMGIGDRANNNHDGDNAGDTIIRKF
jgi:hypothetical protein